MPCLRNPGFGDFIFKLPDGKEIGQVSNVEELREFFEDIPEESLDYHGSNNHFSNWLAARGETRGGPGQRWHGGDMRVVCCAAVPGTTMRGTCAHPIATGTTRRTGTTTTASVVPSDSHPEIEMPLGLRCRTLHGRADQPRESHPVSGPGSLLEQGEGPKTTRAPRPVVASAKLAGALLLRIP